ncbi:MAG: hypothetical protein R3Y24_10330 [Eubacteriales bacterium]
MSFKVKESKIIFFLINFLILLDYNFFYIIKQPSFLYVVNNKYNKSLISIICIGLTIYIIVKKGNKIKKYKWTRFYSALLVISIMLVIIITTYIYDKQSILSTIRVSISYFIPILILPILYILEMGYSEKMMRYMEKFVFLWYVICFLQYILFMINNTIIINDYFADGDINMRGGNVRITLFLFGNLFLLYHFDMLLSKNKKRSWHLINFILGVLCVFLVQQTRMFYIADMLGLFIILFFSGKKVNKKIRNMLLFAGGVIMLLLTGAVQALVNSIFFGNDVYVLSSTSIRVSAIEYYISCFIENPLIALGFVSDGTYYNLVHGISGSYYYSDVGYIGVLAQTGVFSIIIYIIPLLRMFYITLKCIKKTTLEECAFMISICCFLSILSMTIAFTSTTRILAFTWFYALFEYNYKIQCR